MEARIRHYAHTFWTFLDEVSSLAPSMANLQALHLLLFSTSHKITDTYNTSLRRNPKSIQLYTGFLKLFLYDKKQADSEIKRLK